MIECSKCHMTYYCSVDHAKNDVEHRKLCTALQQVAAEEPGKSASVQTFKHTPSHRYSKFIKIVDLLKMGTIVVCVYIYRHWDVTKII